MTAFATSAFTVICAGLMGYSFALLLVVKKSSKTKKIAALLPVFPLLMMFYFALTPFTVFREFIGVLALLSMMAIAYTQLKEVC